MSQERLAIPAGMPKGMHPLTWGKHQRAHILTGLKPNIITQTIGDAELSKNYHAKDGTFLDTQGKERPYCASYDYDADDPTEFTGGQMSQLLLAMAHQGLCPFWRVRPPFEHIRHLHIIDPALKMKPQLKSQVRDFIVGRDGLASRNYDHFWKSFIHQTSWDVIVDRIRRDMKKAGNW